MATSGSVDYSLTRTQIIEEALRTISVLGEGETATASQLSEASTALNIMLKAWMAYGLSLWAIKRQSITPIEGQSSYTLGRSGTPTVTMDRPLDVLEVYRRDTSEVTDIDLMKISREEYWNLPDKDTEGEPNQFYYDPQLGNGVLHIWPVADSTFASDKTLEIFYRKPFDDMDAATDDLDFPQEWYEAIKFGLAYRLSFQPGIPAMDKSAIKQMANETLDLALSWDTEHTPVYFQPKWNR